MRLWNRLQEVVTGGGVTVEDESTAIRYRCTSCKSEFELCRQVCPRCGGYRIARTDWGLTRRETEL